ncbi:hypothetical protein ACPC54_39510 [Kitasatospora sp. NPDC094028]
MPTEAAVLSPLPPPCCRVRLLAAATALLLLRRRPEPTPLTTLLAGL